jgi:hypothetical protein
MRCTYLVTLALVAAVPAFAQQHVTPPPGIEEPPAPPPPPGGVSVSSQGRIVLSADVCGKLRRVAAADPGADYRPGVDVDGNAVAPADLPSRAPPVALDDLPIVIGGKLQQRYGIAANSTLLHRGALIGMVTLRDGLVYFNGEPISGNERDMMLAACAEANR